jgi:copper chaperone CopZ
MFRHALALFLALTVIVPSAEAIAPPDRVYELDFEKLNCAICRKAIKETLTKLDTVKSVEYDLKAYKCIVTMRGQSTLTAATVQESFKGSKYVFKSINERR